MEIGQENIKKIFKHTAKMKLCIELTPSPMEWLVLACVAVLMFLKVNMDKAKPMKTDKKGCNKPGTKRA